MSFKTDIFKEDAIDNLEEGDEIKIDEEEVEPEEKIVEVIKPMQSNAKLSIDEEVKNSNLDFKLNIKEEEIPEAVTVVKPKSNIVFDLEDQKEQRMQQLKQQLKAAMQQLKTKMLQIQSNLKVIKSQKEALKSRRKSLKAIMMSTAGKQQAAAKKKQTSQVAEQGSNKG